MIKKMLFILLVLGFILVQGCEKTTQTEPLKQCDLACGDYHYSNCPEGCLERCVGSCPACEDCDGPGSCVCPP